ncbi:MAG TPA: transglycosylase domain-containing protein [Solirubrobacteraceae bacterium]|nr:transglycosylase domain-containing protein [Solirubrobacteraceae bacterium]
MSRRERQRRRRRNRGSALGRFFALTGMLAVSALIVGALAVVGWVVNVAQSAPNLSELHPVLPGSPSQIFAADGTSLGYIHSQDVRTPVSGSVIPQILKEATIAIEDRRFYQHGALDYQGILRAAVKDAFNGGGLQGASTLTMQLVDNVYMTPRMKQHHDLKYKIEQAKLAQQLEARHPDKNWILTSYLNDVPYGTVGGQTAYGVAAASNMFFNTSVRRLDLAQAALLAGLPQAPSQYNPFIDSAAARHRRNEVLQAMVAAHYVTQAQASAAERSPLQVHPNTAAAIHRQPYVFDYIAQAAANDLCPRTPNNCPVLTEGGLKIHSTIDLRKQALARAAILAHEGGPGQPAAGLASIDPNNGHILAIASSADYRNTTFDYATQAHRQPGSSFKAFVLMTLIHDEHGDPNQTFYNSHQLLPGWLPGYPTFGVQTAELSYQGNISVAKATWDSDNTVFAQLDADLTPQKVTQTAYAMGITTHLDSLPAEAIGGLRTGVTPLEMADAYSTLANGGSHVPATIINTITFPDGSVRDFGNPPRKRIFTDGEAYEGTKTLEGVITQGTGTAANYGCPAAGKTGTSELLANAWFVGYTPRMATAVWVGYPQGNIPMANGFGGTLAAPIWHDYMSQASGGYCGQFPTPTTPFVGTSYFGHYATTGAPAPTSTSGGGGGTATAPAAKTKSGGVGVTGTGAYNNPTLYASPPQTGPGGGAGAAGPGKSGKPSGGSGHGAGTGH